MDEREVRRIAAALAARCEPKVNRLARELAERRFAAIPDYAGLPADMRDLEIAGTARYAIRQFLDMAAGTRVDEDDLRLFLERAAQRAEEGVGLSTLLSTYYIGAELIWDALVAEVRPGEQDALPMLARLQIRGTNRVVTAVADAYQAAQAAIQDERRDALREVARALLAGEPARATADRYGIPLPDAYLVLNLRLPEQPPTGVAGRRLLRRVRAALEGFAGGTLLTLLDGRGVHVLLPRDAAGRTAELRRALARAGTGTEAVTAGAAPSRGAADVPEASGRAARIARIARATGRPPGLYELRDVLLDYHLSGAPDGGRELAAALDPLDDHPELMATLRAFLDQDLDRRRTAAALAVHPNTVDNRLARTARLIGVDPRTTRGTLLCATALTLRRLG
ncbi:CdaR family transcriptional regulator [Actinomadura sp. WMMB 499]|uniref:PucR family transcriptional regulator n=1 Tax=Actinomadura sp. WMMB 499 TaxID=1219491 RepID=UPI001248F893|nr:helix-turn-helix domain-containing protein [Actinomadura sp. WMMB 499]QFG20620.1 PucR family transcriptional regulator [Actinomadura sp. WMMB 499]